MNATIPHGLFRWHELLTTDPQAANAFYTRVIGWGPTHRAGGPMSYISTPKNDATAARATR